MSLNEPILQTVQCERMLHVALSANANVRIYYIFYPA
jgi:hypothetical protein